MFKSRALIVMLPTALFACAQAVSQDFIDDDDGSGGHAVSGGVGSGGKTSGSGGKTSSTAGKGGSGTQAFGGTATSGGMMGEGGEDTGGTGGSATAGSGGKTSGGTGGMTSGGTGGTGGGGSSGSGGGGTGQVGKGDCATTPQFQVGAGTKYAKDALVVAVCTTGTPCTQEQPALQTGKQYEFKCLDEYNCGTQDPGTTNWSVPPWKVTRACE